MCQICIDFQKGQMTLIEAYRNQEEMNPNDKHFQEVLDMLNDKLWDDVFNSSGSDYQEAEDIKNSYRSKDVDPLFWYDDLLEWQDY